MKESPIFAKTRVLLVWLLERTERFRKTQRFVLAKRVQDDILGFHECLIAAAKSREPLRSLHQADIHLEQLRHHVRICVDLRLLTVRQYEYASAHVVDIGKLLGGWMGSVRTGRRSGKQATGSDSEAQAPRVAGRLVEQQSKKLPLGQSQQEQPEQPQQQQRVSGGVSSVVPQSLHLPGYRVSTDARSALCQGHRNRSCS